MAFNRLWVSSHIGILGNEIRDSLAQGACQYGSEMNIDLSMNETSEIYEFSIMEN